MGLLPVTALDVVVQTNLPQEQDLISINHTAANKQLRKDDASSWLRL